jgi:hypothetical protein
LLSMGFHGFPMKQLRWVSILIYMGFHGFPRVANDIHGMETKGGITRELLV